MLLADDMMDIMLIRGQNQECGRGKSARKKKRSVLCTGSKFKANPNKKRKKITVVILPTEKRQSGKI